MSMHFRDLPSQVWYLTVSRPSLPGCMRPTLVIEFKNCQWEDILLTPLWLPWAPVNSYEHIWALRLDWTRCGVLQWARAKLCNKTPARIGKHLKFVQVLLHGCVPVLLTHAFHPWHPQRCRWPSPGFWRVAERTGLPLVYLTLEVQ